MTPRRAASFNERNRMADALAGVIRDVDARVMAVSYNDESWVSIDQLEADDRRRAGVRCARSPSTPGATSARRSASTIPQGRKVGKVSRLRNVEYVVVGGDADTIRAVAGRFAGNLAPVTFEPA